jgi:hypothetical protein
LRAVFIGSLFLSSCAFSQIEVIGKVISKNSGEPVAYANIGILNSNIGTISNSNGSFSLIVPQQYAEDTIIFSALGFQKNFFIVHQLSKNESIVLEENIIQLKTVTVEGSREKNRIFELGNPSVKGGVIETDTAYAGRSVALLINNKGRMHQPNFEFPAYLQSARIRIYRNNLSAFKFRVRIQNVDSSTGLPGADILQESIISQSEMRNGWLEFDFSRLNVIISAPFFLTFEQLLDSDDRKRIADGYREFTRNYPDDIEYDTLVINGEKQPRRVFKRRGMDLPGVFIGISGASDDYTSCVREASHAPWKKTRGILTATVKMANQPSNR